MSKLEIFINIFSVEESESINRVEIGHDRLIVSSFLINGRD